MSPPIRVLVVDDDLAVAHLHRAWVEQMPAFAVVAQAHTGAEALRALALHQPDLVLLDVFLPDVPGTQVLRTVRAGGGHQPDVIALTAARELETVRSALAGGVFSYLVKPFSRRIFAERMDAYAAHHAEVARRARGAVDDLGQRDVDRLLHRLGTSASALPKGLSARTLDLVAHALRSAGGRDLSAAEVAAECGLARVSARRYLEHLERVGLAVVHPRYGSAGRPENGYRWLG